MVHEGRVHFWPYCFEGCESVRWNRDFARFYSGCFILGGISDCDFWVSRAIVRCSWMARISVFLPRLYAYLCLPPLAEQCSSLLAPHQAHRVKVRRPVLLCISILDSARTSKTYLVAKAHSQPAPTPLAFLSMQWALAFCVCVVEILVGGNNFEVAIGTSGQIRFCENCLDSLGWAQTSPSSAFPARISQPSSSQAFSLLLCYQNFEMGFMTSTASPLSE